MAEHPHSHEEPRAPDTPIDAGSLALSEALRSSFGVIKIVMVILVCLFLGSGFFTVGPQERAMVIRLGRVVGSGEKALLGPGLHWSFPYPIDEYVKVPITAIQKVRSTVGWYLTTPEQELAGTEITTLPVSAPINALVDGYVVTADKNILHARATLTYHITDPVGFIFNFVNASNMVQTALDNALLSVASGYNVDDVMTRDFAGFSVAVRRQVSQTLAQQKLGVEVEECLVQRTPPRQLKEAFDSVLRAEVNRQKALQEARSDENKKLSKAQADAQSITNAAQSDRVRLVNEVSSQAERFKDLLPQYRANPDLFVQQRLTETLGRVLTNVQDKIFLSEGAPGTSRELRLLLNREPPKRYPDEQKEQKP